MSALDYIVEGMRYVFLDRDGVLNRKPPEGDYVRGWSQWEWLPGAIEAVGRMNRTGMVVMVVTNQRGIALGLYTEAQLREIHQNMRSDLAERGAHIDAIYYCPHDRGVCDCRKPGTGMFEQARKHFPDIKAENSVMIGDSVTDIEAGRRLGMKTIFIQGEEERQKPGAVVGEEAADVIAGSLLKAVELISSWAEAANPSQATR